MENQDNLWLKNRGYLHITPKIDVLKKEREIINKLNNPEFVKRHSFFPLIHYCIKERRYKKVGESERRAHSYLDLNQEFVSSSKKRPIHYATHIDALIFGYYSDKIQKLYENELTNCKELSNCIIAYRKIKHEEENRNKNTIDFAKDVFEEINKRAKIENTVVLKLDITKFFSSLDHKHLKKAWSSLFFPSSLPLDHYKVFKAVTRFNYILLDDLRVHNNGNGFKSHFDEKKLANLKKLGVLGYFKDVYDFREHIKSGKLKVYRNPYFNDSKEQIGIPQGLPISAALANLYLLEFDKIIYNNIVVNKGAFYRRYCDDIIVICNLNNYEEITKLLKGEIKAFKLDISDEKTETFKFVKRIYDFKGSKRIECIKVLENYDKIGIPFSYLGFEYYGYMTLAKSSNLAKFYRRMILSVKRKSTRAEKSANKNLYKERILFKRRLFNLYSFNGINKKLIYPPLRVLEQKKGEFYYKTKERKKPIKYRGNYLTYIIRSSEIMNDSSLRKQIRNHYKILKKAISKHFNP